jgi:hypothetical protein
LKEKKSPKAGLDQNPCRSIKRPNISLRKPNGCAELNAESVLGTKRNYLATLLTELESNENQSLVSQCSTGL